MAHHAKKSVLDPLLQSFLDDLAAKGGAPIYTLSPKEAREALNAVQAATPVMKLPVDIEDRTIKSGDMGDLSIRIYRPQGNVEKLPVILYIHGAGWVMGNMQTHDRLVREICVGTQAAVVFVNYSLAPEGQYPLAHEQCYMAAEWLGENGASLNLDTTRMAIAGDSVGGLLATAVAMISQERGGPKFIFQLLFYPVTDANFETESYKQFATGYWLEREGMKWFWDQYVPKIAMREEPYASPLKASLEQLKHMPPALIITNECDVLRDEAEAYARKLMQAGVPTVAVRYLGMIHDSVMLNAITKAAPVRAAIEQAIDTLKKVLAKKQ